MANLPTRVSRLTLALLIGVTLSTAGLFAQAAQAPACRDAAARERAAPRVVGSRRAGSTPTVARLSPHAPPAARPGRAAGKARTSFGSSRSP